MSKTRHRKESAYYKGRADKIAGLPPSKSTMDHSVYMKGYNNPHLPIRFLKDGYYVKY